MDAEGIKGEFFGKLGDVGELLKVMELLPEVSFFLKDRECRFVGLNARGREYCGVTREEDALGKTDHDFFPRSERMGIGQTTRR